MNAAEFNRKWLPLSEPLYRLALYILEDAQNAEDAVQDLLLKLWRSRDRLADVGSPKAYALTMMRNLCLDRLRSAARKPVERATEELPVFTSQEDDFGSRDRLDRVMKAIESLPDRQRRALVLRAVDELDYQQIASDMGTTELNVRVLVSTARKTLKKKL